MSSSRISRARKTAKNYEKAEGERNASLRAKVVHYLSDHAYRLAYRENRNSPKKAIAAETLFANTGIIAISENNGTVIYFRSDRSRLSISKGNSKLEGIPQFNLSAVESCRKCNLPCAQDCYAAHLENRYPSTERAWAGNLALVRTDLPFVKACLKHFLETKAPRFFRFHTAGDFDGNQEYVDTAISLARDFSGTRFMAYTKIHELDFRARPANMTVVLSQWPGWDTDNVDMTQFDGQTFVQDGTENRIPAGTHKCPGSCANCRACWLIAKKPNCAVYFQLHK